MEETSQQQYSEASLKTGNNLRQVAYAPKVRELSHLSLPEIDNMIDVVARVAPAGNVPGLILNGLARLSGRRPPADVIKRDVNLLFKGVEKALDKAVYGAFFAGPAAIIWGYQNLLKLSGKDSENAFPEGTWQFYVDYAMREDTARHVVETDGFDRLLKNHQVQLSPIERTTAWVMAGIYALHQYHEWLANEWRERTHTYLLQSVTAEQPDAAQYAQLYQKWCSHIPYQRGPDADPSQNYAAYRRHAFEQFLAEQMQGLKPALRRQWAKRTQAANSDLLAYQQQLSILAYLEADTYGETRQPLPIEQAHVGIIHQERYYLIPACVPGTWQPQPVEIVRDQIAAFMNQPTAKSSVQLTGLAGIRRSALAEIQDRFNETLAEGLVALRTAPILLNMDQKRPSHLPLTDIRQTERGSGSHPLTIVDTGQSFVFDQSQIFFDPLWGAALAEIMTNEATAWAFYVRSLVPVRPQVAMRPLSLPFGAADRRLIEQSPAVTPEVSVETKAVKLPALLTLRKQLKQRSDLLALTVSDLLLLYRAIHHITYQLHPNLLADLEKLGEHRRWAAAAKTTLTTFQPKHPLPPAILFPLDASQRVPRERSYPLVLAVPLGDLDLLQLHSQTLAALQAYEKGEGDRSQTYAQFSQHQHLYLAALAGFGTVMHTAKQTAMRGESSAVRTVQLMAQMPTPLQRLLDQIPSRFDILNELLKGREIFSNLGAVARGSSLTRFAPAKDDNDKQALAWGILTDASGTMVISLRDFRPHVAALIAAGHKRLALDIAQHYLDSYARGFNDYVRDLQHITRRSRETILQ
jgi:hypothetical protein